MDKAAGGGSGCHLSRWESYGLLPRHLSAFHVQQYENMHCRFHGVCSTLNSTLEVLSGIFENVKTLMERDGWSALAAAVHWYVL